MAKIKDDDEFDDLNFDDFGDFDELGGFDDLEAEMGNRTPFEQLKGSFFEGVKSSFFDSNNHREVVKTALPKGYSRIYDTVEFSVDTTSDLLDIARKGWDKESKSLKEATRTILPGMGPGVTSSSIGRNLSEWSNNIERPTVTEDIDPEKAFLSSEIGELGGVNHAIDNQTPEALRDLKGKISANAQQKLMTHTAQTSQIISDRTGMIQGQNIERHLSGIHSQITRLTAFQDQVSVQFQRKSLEIQYRQYFVQRKSLEVISQTLELQNSAFEKIIVNTALPEAVKIKNDEHAQMLMREKFIGEVISPAAQNLSNVSRRIVQKGKQKLDQFFKDLGSTLGQVNDASQQLMGEDSGISTWDMIGDQAGAYAGKRAMKSLSEKVARKLSGNKKLSYFGESVAGMINNGGRIFNSMMKSDTNIPMIEWMKSTGFFDEFVYRRDDTIRKDATSSLDDVAMWDQKSRQALTVVIPGWLEKISYGINSIEAFHYGKPAPEREKFNYASGIFEKESVIKAKIHKELLSENANRDTAQAARNMVAELETYRPLSREAKVAVFKEVNRVSLEGEDFDFEDYRKGNKIFSRDPEVQAEIYTALMENYFPEYIEGVDDDASGVSANHRRDASATKRNRFRNAIQNMSNNQGVFNLEKQISLNKTYGTDIMLEMGVGKMDGNRFVFDRARFEDIIAEQMLGMERGYTLSEIHGLEEDENDLGAGYHSKIKQIVMKLNKEYSVKDITQEEADALKRFFDILKSALLTTISNPNKMYDASIYTSTNLDHRLKSDVLSEANKACKDFANTDIYKRFGDDAKSYFDARATIINEGARKSKIDAPLEDFLGYVLEVDKEGWEKASAEVLKRLEEHGLDDDKLAALRRASKSLKDTAGKTFDQRLAELTGTTTYTEAVNVINRMTDKGTKWLMQGMRDPTAPPPPIIDPDSMFTKMSKTTNYIAENSAVGRFITTALLKVDSKVNNSYANMRDNRARISEIEALGNKRKNFEWDDEEDSSKDRLRIASEIHNGFYGYTGDEWGGNKEQKKKFEEAMKEYRESGTDQDLDAFMESKGIKKRKKATSKQLNELKSYKAELEKLEEAKKKHKETKVVDKAEETKFLSKISNAITEGMMKATETLAGKEGVSDNPLPTTNTTTGDNSQPTEKIDSIVEDTTRVSKNHSGGIIGGIGGTSGSTKHIRPFGFSQRYHTGGIVEGDLQITPSITKGVFKVILPNGKPVLVLDKRYRALNRPTPEDLEKAKARVDAHVRKVYPKHFNPTTGKANEEGLKPDNPVAHNPKDTLAENEVPAVLERGEEVLTAKDPRHSKNFAKTLETYKSKVQQRGASLEGADVKLDDTNEILLGVYENTFLASNLLEIIASKEFGEGNKEGFFSKLKRKFTSGVKWIGGKAKSGMNFVRNFASNRLDNIKSAASWIWERRGGIKEGVTNAVKYVGGKAIGGAKYIGEKALAVGGWSLAKAKAIGSKLKEKIPTLEDLQKFGGCIVDNVLIPIKEFVEKRYEATKEWWKEHFPKFKLNFSEFWTKFSEKFKDWKPVEWIKDKASSIYEKVSGGVSGLWEGAKSVIKAPFKALVAGKNFLKKQIGKGLLSLRGWFSGGAWAAMKYRNVEDITDEVSGLRQVYMGIVDLQSIIMDRIPKPKKFTVFDKDGDGKRDKQKGFFERLTGNSEEKTDGKTTTGEKKEKSLMETIFGASMMGLAIKALIGGMVGDFMSKTFGFDLGLIGNSLAGMAAVGTAIWGTKKLAGMAVGGALKGAGALAKGAWNKARGKKGTNNNNDSNDSSLFSKVTSGENHCCCNSSESIANALSLAGIDIPNKENTPDKKTRRKRNVKLNKQKVDASLNTGTVNALQSSAKSGSRFAGMSKYAGKAGGLAAGAVGAYTLYNVLSDDEASPEEKAKTIGETGGSIIGGLGGTAAGASLGAAIGSVIPGVGTAIGGVVGGILGGFAGSGIGEKIGGIASDVVSGAGSVLKQTVMAPVKALSWAGGKIADGAKWIAGKPISAFESAISDYGAGTVTTLATLAGGPIGFALAKTAAGNLEKKKNPITRFRFKQYGLDFDNEKHKNAVLALETSLLKTVNLTKGRHPTINPDRPLEEYLELFKVDPSNEKERNNWLVWFQYRFKPVFLSHISEWYKLMRNANIHDGDEKLGRDGAQNYLKNVHYKNADKAPYVHITNPFGDERSDLHDGKTVNKEFERANGFIAEFPVKTLTDTEKDALGVGEERKNKAEEAKIEKLAESNTATNPETAIKESQEKSTGFFERMGNGISAVAGSIVGGAKNVIGAIGNTASNLYNGAVNAVSDGMTAVANAVDSGTNAAYSGAQAIGGKLTDFVTGTNPKKREAALAIFSVQQGVNNPKELAAILATCRAETDEFRFLKELGNDKYFTKYNNNKDLGNGPNDGAKFKGRGYIQLTGRANYTSAGKALGLDLANRPELVEDINVALKTFWWYWSNRKGAEGSLRASAQAGNFKYVTRLVNGGYTHLSKRTGFYNSYLSQIGNDINGFVRKLANNAGMSMGNSVGGVDAGNVPTKSTLPSGSLNGVGTAVSGAVGSAIAAGKGLLQKGADAVGLKGASSSSTGVSAASGISTTSNAGASAATSTSAKAASSSGSTGANKGVNVSTSVQSLLQKATPELVALGKKHTVALGGANVAGMRPEFMQLFYACVGEYVKSGFSGKIQIVDAHRTYAEQVALYKKYGSKRAARPGHSRHEFGIALDLNNNKIMDTKSGPIDKFFNSGIPGKWGFHRPLLRNKKGIVWEPWHIESKLFTRTGTKTADLLGGGVDNKTVGTVAGAVAAGSVGAAVGGTVGTMADTNSSGGDVDTGTSAVSSAAYSFKSKFAGTVGKLTNSQASILSKNTGATGTDYSTKVNITAPNVNNTTKPKINDTKTEIEKTKEVIKGATAVTGGAVVASAINMNNETAKDVKNSVDAKNVVDKTAELERQSRAAQTINEQAKTTRVLTESRDAQTQIVSVLQDTLKETKQMNKTLREISDGIRKLNLNQTNVMRGNEQKTTQQNPVQMKADNVPVSMRVS